jgi:adenylate kinase family enzyme
MEQLVGKRIIVTGSSNAGKSTLAGRLAARLDVPYIDLDALYWEPGWVEAEPSFFQDRIRAAIEPDSWVMAGNYLSKQQEVSWPRADTIVFLDLPLPTLLRRCTRRCWQRWRSQEALYGGENRENLWEHLMLWNTDKSLIAHITTTHRRRRRDFEAMSRDRRWAHLTFIRLRSIDEIDDWFARVGAHSLVTNGTGISTSFDARAV